MLEGSMEWYRGLFQQIINDGLKNKVNQRDCLDLLLNMREDFTFSENKEVRDYAMKISKYAHEMAGYMAAQTGSGEFDDLYWKYLLLEAQNYQVDSGLLYLEKNRLPKERFYEPRREVFVKHQIIQNLQDLMDDELDIFGLSVPPGCGKSTLEDFFLSLVGGWFPNAFNLSSAHSSILTRSLYDGVLEIINDPVEYTWHEIFPTVQLTNTNAKETTVNLERNGRFKTWTFRSIDGSLTGATRCNRFLTADGGENPSVEELLAQLAEERAKSARLQNEKDSVSSEAANFKKQLRAKMTANEQEEAAKAEAEAAKDAKIQELETKFRLMDYSKRFMGVGMDETSATELAGLTGEIAEPDKFFSALDKFVKATIKKAGEDSVEALIKSNPSIKAGNGDGAGESLAVRKAKELAGGVRTVNQDILKNYL